MSLHRAAYAIKRSDLLARIRERVADLPISTDAKRRLLALYECMYISAFVSRRIADSKPAQNPYKVIVVAEAAGLRHISVESDGIVGVTPDGKSIKIPIDDFADFSRITA